MRQNRMARLTGQLREQFTEGGSATYYQPTDKLTGAPEALSSKLEPLSSNPDALSSKSDGLSSKPGTQSSNPDQQARDALLNQLPGHLAAQVGALGQRHPPERVRDLVVTLCEQRDWRVEELALLLLRNAETIRQNYLRPLLAQKRIVMTLPDTPNSPQQAYRAAGGQAE